MDGQRTTSDCASMRFKGKYRARFEYEQMLRRETWEQTKKYNRPRCAVCCHGLLGAEKVVEFSVGAGKAFRSEGSQPLDDNASFHGRRRLQRWGRTPRVFRHDQSRKEKSYPKCTISELQSNVQRHNCSPVHDQTLAGTLASFIIHHLTCLRDSTA